MKIKVNTSSNVRVASNDEIIRDLQNRYIEIQQEIENFSTFANHYEFPSIGDPDDLYIATDENIIYRWDHDPYVALSGLENLQSQIERIYGGGAQ